MTPYAKTNALVSFIRQHGLQAIAINGYVHFECADGDSHKVRTMAEAREILGYDPQDGRRSY